jgi:rhodanese-related sulfurtransferase
LREVGATYTRVAVTDGAESVEELLSAARRELTRLSPQETREAMREGDILIDIRSDAQRASDGLIPGAAIVPRNVLEWRLDPRSDHRDHQLAGRDRRVIVICDEGYQSSLAAATVRRFGVDATDVVGGFQAWRDAGLPVTQ